MREVLFRGKAEKTKGWVQGSLLMYADGACFICQHSENPDILDKYLVDDSTVGQFTGKTAKHGAKIFEGDIVEYKDERGKIEYDESLAMFVIHFDTWCTDFDHIYGYELEVLGNTIDNPELEV